MYVVYFSVDENVACISMYIITGHECSHKYGCVPIYADVKTTALSC